MCGLRGLMVKLWKFGDIGGVVIENLILLNFVDGLLVLEYFIFMYGVCKGLVDIVLKMVDVGYLICWLVDVF